MGGIVGILVAWLFKNLVERDEIEKEYFTEEDSYEPRYLLPRDTFEKTIQERQQEMQYWRSDDTRF